MSLLPTRCRLLLNRGFERDPAVRQLRRVVTERLEDCDVLEIGCGFGANGARCRGTYVGVDLDPSAVAAARSNAPDRWFLTWDVVRDGDVPGAPFHTVLLCMTVHELGAEREAVVTRAAHMAGSRLLVVDYDPDLRGWPRLREAVLEMGKLGGYLRFDLDGFLTGLGWQVVSSERIGDLHVCWEYERCP